MRPKRALLGALSAAILADLALSVGIPPTARADDPQAGITHAFLATGGETYIRDGKGAITWR